jgi:ATP-dependent RNA helicase MSS116, mitochondrial
MHDAAYSCVCVYLQVGLPSDKAQYIHRLGRTARAGKAGEGVLLLCDFERSFLQQVSTV